MLAVHTKAHTGAAVYSVTAIMHAAAQTRAAEHTAAYMRAAVNSKASYRVVILHMRTGSFKFTVCCHII